MAFIRRTLASRAIRVHLFLFVIVAPGMAILDWVQGTDATSTVLGLDWAHILIAMWIPILLIHAVVSWFGNEYVDALDKQTRRKLMGSWLTGGHKE